MPKRDVSSVWISVGMEGIGAVAAYSHVMMQGVEYERARTWPYASRDYLELYRAMLAMVRIAPSAVPPEQ